MARHQKGSLRKRYGSWSVRYYDGEGQHSAVLGRVDEYPRKSDILPVFEDFMRQVNDQMLGTTDPFIVSFVDDVYLPSLRLAESTIEGYNDIWRVHVKDRVKGLTMSQIKPSTVSRLLEEIAAGGKSKTTIQHIKHFISGIFTYARQHGHYDSGNPVTGLKLPKAKGPADTYAYSLDESQKMLDKLSGAAKVAVAIATYAGLDRGELQGLKWEDFRNGDLYIERKIWESIIKEPKTDQRKAPVPVIEPLQKIIDAYRVQIGKPKEGWLFTASRGKLPMRMDNIARREIIPNLPDGVAWHGWHAFRRGLATNLRASGVPDDIITRILRHADIGTAQRFYSKTLDGNVRDAMDRFGEQASK